MPDGNNRAYLTDGQDFRLPTRSLLDRKFLTVIKQQFDFSCGSAALATLLHFHYGDAQSEQSVFIGMWQDGDREQIRRLGFSLLDMKRYLRSRGIDADGYSVTLAQIRGSGLPGIALIDLEGYKHFVTIKGVSQTEVLMGDPALGIRRMSLRDFARIWNGVYFVVNSGAQLLPSAFNSDTDRSLTARPGIDEFPQPMSLQALALTRPLPGDL